MDTESIIEAFSAILEKQVELIAYNAYQKVDKLRELQRNLLENFKGEEISIFNPFYTSTMKPLTEDQIKMFQKQFIPVEFKGEVLVDKDGKTIMPREAVEHVIVDSHLRNLHS